MQLVYIEGTFLKIEIQQESIQPSKLALRALFYDEQTKTWGNSFAQDEMSKMDYLLNQQEFNERKWVLLKKNTSKITNEKYEQKGPYSSREIFDFISQSTVRLMDPIWKDGMTTWERIRDTRNFKVLQNFSEPIETDVADILSHVMEYDPEMHRVEDKKPSPGAPGEVFIILDDK